MPCAWLPAEAAITPRWRCWRRRSRALRAPRSLKLPVRCEVVELAVDVAPVSCDSGIDSTHGERVDAAVDPRPRGLDVGERQLGVARRHQNGNARPGFTARSTRRNSSWMRASAAASSASKRSTIDRRGVRRAREPEAVGVFDAQAVDGDDLARAVEAVAVAAARRSARSSRLRAA